MSLTLRKRRLQGNREEKMDFVGMDLSSSAAYGSHWIGCTFTDCDMAVSDFQTAEFIDCKFTRCDLRATSFRAAQMRHVRFEECDMRQSAFVGITPLERVVFQNCRLQYASFYDSTVRDVVFLDSNLHGSDLRYIEAHRVKYQGSNLWGAFVQLGCQFMNNEFDDRMCDLFTALVARRHPNEEKRKILADVAGISVKIVERLIADQGNTA